MLCRPGSVSATEHSWQLLLIGIGDVLSSHSPAVIDPFRLAQIPDNLRRLLKSFFKNLAQTIAHDEFLAWLQCQGEDAQMICTARLGVARLGEARSGQNTAGIVAGRHVNPRFALAQLLIALSHGQAKLLFVPRYRKGGETVLLFGGRGGDGCL